jgi:hypothetical protein
MSHTQGQVCRMRVMSRSAARVLRANRVFAVIVENMGAEYMVDHKPKELSYIVESEESAKPRGLNPNYGYRLDLVEEPKREYRFWQS